MKQIKIIKNRSDIGAGTRGSDMGVDAIEIAAINAGNNYFTRFPFTNVESQNWTIYYKVKALFAKRITHVREQCQRVADAVEKVLREDNFALVLAGDHSSALGTISGVKAYAPEKRLGVIWIDAHGDLHSPYTSPSGNIHGMPLAAALSDDNLDFQINNIETNTKREWETMKNIGVKGAKVLPEDLIFFGVRDTEEPEDKLMEKHGIKNYMVHEVRYRGLKTCVDEALHKLRHCDMIYISFDVDSLDCDLISKGTGTPVSKGFDIQEVKDIITQIIDSEKVACLEICEVNPLLDEKGNRMAEAAFDVLDHLTTHYLEKQTATV